MRLLKISVAGAALLASIGAAAAQDAAAGEKVFAKCKVCHQIGETAKNFVGPVAERRGRAEGGLVSRLPLFQRQ